MVGTVLGSAAGGLGMDTGRIAAASLLAILLGLVFGGLALAIGAAKGRTRLAAQGSVGVALVTYVLNSFRPLSEDLADLARLSPLYYYLSGQPLTNGLDVLHALVLGGLFVGLVVIAVVRFERRDLRRGSA